MKTFPYYRQRNEADCGPTCLRMIAKFHGKQLSHHYLMDISGMTHLGVSMLGICDAAEKIGFRATGFQLKMQHLKEVQLPVILHWAQRHFVVLFKIKRNCYYIADPAEGIVKYDRQEFLAHWQIPDHNTKAEGYVLTFNAPVN